MRKSASPSAAAVVNRVIARALLAGSALRLLWEPEVARGRCLLGLRRRPSCQPPAPGVWTSLAVYSRRTLSPELGSRSPLAKSLLARGARFPPQGSVRSLRRVDGLSPRRPGSWHGGAGATTPGRAGWLELVS